MRLCVLVVAVAGLAQSVLAQGGGWTYEMRLVADGDGSSPAGAWPQYDIGSSASTIGFWLQARVRHTTSTTNYGVYHGGVPVPPNTSSIIVNDPVVGGSGLAPGAVNASGTLTGRGVGYRIGGWGSSGGYANDGAGALDANHLRIWGFDAARPYQISDSPTNPYGVNGDGTPGVTVPVGQFSPWANLYRFVVNSTGPDSARTIQLTAFAQIRSATDAMTIPDTSNWILETGPVFNMTATYSYTFGVPAPGAAAGLALAGAFAARRRRP